MSDDLLTRLKEKSVQPRFSESLPMKIFKQLASIETALANGYTGKQIAEELEIEPALFYSALQRARKKALKIAAAGGQQPKAANAPNQNQNSTTNQEKPPEKNTTSKPPITAKPKTEETPAQFDMTTAEGRRAAQAARFNDIDNEGE
jgi:transposase